MTKTYHHGDLKEATIKQALRFIEERSGTQFTLREVATELNVSHTAIYRHFQSRIDLLSCIAEVGYNKLNDLFETIVEDKRSPKKKLHDLSFIYMKFSLDYPEYYRCMFNPELKCGDQELKESLNQASTKTYNFLLQTLEVATGKRNKATEAMASSVWASLHGFCDLNLNGQLFHQKMTKKELEVAFLDHVKFIVSKID